MCLVWWLVVGLGETLWHLSKVMKTYIMRLHWTTINNNRHLVASRHFSSRSGGMLGRMQTRSDIQKGDWMSNDGNGCLFYRWNLLVILEWWKNHWKGTTGYTWLPSETKKRIINSHCFCWLNQLGFFKFFLFSVRAAARGRLSLMNWLQKPWLSCGSSLKKTKRQSTITVLFRISVTQRSDSMKASSLLGLNCF